MHHYKVYNTVAQRQFCRNPFLQTNMTRCGQVTDPVWLNILPNATSNWYTVSFCAWASNRICLHLKFWNRIKFCIKGHEFKRTPTHVVSTRNTKDEYQRSKMSLVVLCWCLQKTIKHQRHLSNAFSVSSLLQPVNVCLPQFVRTEF